MRTPSTPSDRSTGRLPNMKSALRTSLLVVGIVASALTAVGVHAAEGPVVERQVRRVLILDQEGSTRPAFVEFVQGFRAALAEAAEDGYEVFVENLDLMRLGRLGGDLQRATGWLLEKYSDAPFDVIVSTSAVTRDFVLANRAAFAPEATLVAVNRPGELPVAGPPPASTFVATGATLAETIELGLRLFPASRRIALVGQSRPHPRLLEVSLDEARRAAAEQGVAFVPLLDLPLADLRARLRELPADSIVVYLGFWKDEPSGMTHVPATVLETLVRDTTAPIFGVIDTYLGRGIVGGVCTDAKAVGAAAARLAVASQTGPLPGPVTVPPAVLLDRRALDRFGVPDSRLPPGSRIAFDEPGFWDRYWPQALAAGSLLVVEALLITALINQLRRRRRAERLVDEQRALIIHAGRVSTLGQFAASLAHELGQPLGAILNNLEAAEMLLRDDTCQHAAELREIIGDIAADDQRAGAVLERLRAMVRRQPFSRAAVDAAGLFRGTLALAGPRLAADRIDVSIDCPPGLPPIAGDETLLQQAILNLVSNSADAIRSSPAAIPGRPGSPPVVGRITLAARRDGETVELTVTDTGGGLSEAVADDAMEPFATTKESGLGMGLPIVRSIIEQHDGRLQLANDPGLGLAVRIWLPAWTKVNSTTMDRP